MKRELNVRITLQELAGWQFSDDEITEIITTAFRCSRAMGVCVQVETVKQNDSNRQV